jgi:transcriptional regulator with XRE-family HTH domain
VYFQELQARLVDIARERVQAGKLTGRGLARLCGVSQPHMHNVLNNIRSLSTNAADRLMRALDVSVSDLLWHISTEPEAGVEAIPMIHNRIGPGTDAVFTELRGHIPLPRWLLRDLVDPLAARLGPDLVLPKALAAHDLVLLDQNPQARAGPGSNSIWVVIEDAGLRVRYLRMGGARICVANEVTLKDPRKWHSIPPQGQNILDIVRARIVWMGREMEKEPAGPADPAC